MSDRPGEMDERDVDQRFASIVAGWDSALPDDEVPHDDADARTGEAPDGTGDARGRTGDAPGGTGDAPGGTGVAPGGTSDAPGGTGEAPGGTGEAPDAAAEAPAPGDRPDDDRDAGRHEPGGRPPWVNPSPLDVVIPASSWRVSPPPATGAGTSSTPQPAADDPDDHFEPPPVTLPPQEDLHFWGAVIGLVGGPLLLLYVALARPFHSDRWFAAGVVLSLLGFALLVLRQPRHRDPGDPDDGARV